MGWGEQTGWAKNTGQSLEWEGDLSVCRVERKANEAGTWREKEKQKMTLGREAGTRSSQ